MSANPNFDPNPAFKLTVTQQKLLAYARSPRIAYLMAAGGIRSSKSAGLAVEIFERALDAPGSIHGIFHGQLNVCRRNLMGLTFPEMIDLVYPGYWAFLKNTDRVNKTDSIITLPNESRLMFFGLDDADKIRGTQMATAWINEANIGVTYNDFTTVAGRLSQTVLKSDGTPLDQKLFIDLNPKVKSSWEYQLFVRGVIPGTNDPIPDPSLYTWVHMNPKDNVENLPEGYLERIFAGYTEDRRKQDELGLWLEDNPNALFDLKDIARGPAPDLKLTVVAIDPSGSSHAKSDLCGIVVAGLGYDNRFYVLEDASFRGKPEEWASKAGDLFHEYGANYIVAEKNYGGDMVRTVIEQSNRGGFMLPVETVVAKKSKTTRAEPIQVLYRKGLVTHTDRFEDLEQQMIEFDSDGFKGSPDRVDALVWGLTFLSQRLSQPSPAAHIGRMKW